MPQRQKDHMTLVQPETVVWVEAASQYARVHTQDAEFMISRPLADVATRLPREHFIRVHRSALINRHFVRQIRRDRGGLRLLMAGGEEVAVSRGRRKQVLKHLESAVEPLS